jgi:outer membrane protein assembly factor BamD
MLRSAVYILFIAFSVLLASCSEFRRIQKNTDWKVKYDAALKYYESKDYYRSITLFEEILPFIRGSREAEEVQFLNAYAHYHQKDYVLAGHYFKTFYETYSRSENAEEAFYMYVYSLYKQSPGYNLDQTSTNEALASVQTFLNRYPNSAYREKAIEIIRELMGKIEQKEFENARLYYKLGRLNAALIALNNFKMDYPDSKQGEEACYLLVVCSSRYARQSIPSRQRERYYECISHYEYFIDNYPDSRYIRELQDYYSQSISAIEKLNQSNL